MMRPFVVISLWYYSVFGIILGFKQDDYTFKFLIVKLERLNHSYATDLKCNLGWFNRSTRVINCNGHLLKDLSANIKLESQVYKFASNEYRLFPVQMSVDGCPELDIDRFGLLETFKNSLNFKLKCPFKKGYYSMKNATIDYTKFPPHFPRGQYMDQTIFRDNNNFVAELRSEFLIEDIIKKWEY